LTKYYPVAKPVLAGNEKKYILECIETNWVSSIGRFLDLFEASFASYCGTRYAIACSSGTTALHLALCAAGVQPGDEVLVPTLTFIATANAVTYCGAKPVFIDCDPRFWTMDSTLLEAKINSKTKAIVPVHLYGHPVDMLAVQEIADKYNLFVIEDAAEALGAEYKGRKTGSLGDAAIFSFFGNKTITTGEGGMLTTNNSQLAEQARLLRGQGLGTERRYWHEVIGFNYRMTNLQAALGIAQMERIEWYVEERIRVAKLYLERLVAVQDYLILPQEADWAKHVYWMFGVLIKGATEKKRDRIMQTLAERGVETRPFFYPMHMLPPYQKLEVKDQFPIAAKIAAQGISLPTYANLTEADIDYITSALKEVVVGASE
jgi:perosamine synthetase